MSTPGSVPKVKKEKFKKYQYTKPYKDRDKTKDFGKNLPLKKGRKLKFPEKPQYYTLYTAQKLPTDHPFYNIRNKDLNALARAVKEAKESLNRGEKGQVNEEKAPRKGSISQSGRQSIELRSSLFNGLSHSKDTSRNEFESNKSSLGIITITDKSEKQCPFNKGFSVTSGPKVYKGSGKISITDQKSIEVRTPGHSVLSSNQLVRGDAISDNYLNEIYQHSERPSV